MVWCTQWRWSFHFISRHRALWEEILKAISLFQTAQHHEWLWWNDHQEGVVYSTACTKEVQHKYSAAAEELPCQKCGELLTLKAFKNIVHKSHLTDEKYRHVNNEYQNDRLASLFGCCSGLHKIIEVSAAC